MSDRLGEPAASPLKRVPASFRTARPEEFDVLSRILCNAFLPLWSVSNTISDNPVEDL